MAKLPAGMWREVCSFHRSYTSAFNSVIQLHNTRECLVSGSSVFGFPFGPSVMVSLPHRVSRKA